MVYKPVDTAIIMVVGPLIDNTDSKSLEEAIAYNAAGMDVSLIVEKTDGTTTVTTITLTTGGTSDWTHKDGGYYEIEITAAQNISEGIGYIRGICDGVLPFESSHYDIVKANIYDSWIKGTDKLQTDLTEIKGFSTTTTRFENFLDICYDDSNYTVRSNLRRIHDADLTETVHGYLSAAFVKLFDVATPLLIASDVMRGTDSAALASICTNTRLAELDEANLPFEIAQIESDTTNILADTGELQTDWVNGGRLDNLLDAIPTTAMRGTDGANTTVPDAAGTLASYDPPTRAEATADKDAIIADLLTMKQKVAGTYNRETDSLEAVRDRGDDAWITGISPTVIAIREEMDSNSVNLNSILEDTNELQLNQGNWTTATGFAVPNEYDTEMARIDTTISSRNAIAPNIVIPDVAGTAATLHGITDGKIDVVDGIVDAIKLQTDNLPSGISKGEVLPKFDFLMVLSSDHVSAATGKTVTGEISKDGGTFAVITNTITEVSSGMYTIADGFTATEMNANIITLKFDADDSDTRIISIITS